MRSAIVPLGSLGKEVSGVIIHISFGEILICVENLTDQMLEKTTE